MLPLFLLLALRGLAQAQFNYMVDNGTITITKYTGPGGDVVIPDTIDGLPVISIGTQAFMGGVKSIENHAFRGCHRLASINIPDNVTRIVDLSLLVATKNRPAVNSEDPRDLDGDGMITVLDARILVTLFSVPGGLLHAVSRPEGVVRDWARSAGAVKLQSTTDLQNGPWKDVGELQSSTNAVIGNTEERMFFRLVLPE